MFPFDDVIMFADGRIMSAGENTGYQLGRCDQEDQTTFGEIPDVDGITDIDVGESHCLALRQDGAVSLMTITTSPWWL